MLELIATIILVVSVVGMGFIAYRKIPALAELSDNIEEPAQELWQNIKNKITNVSFVKNFSPAAFLQKALSKIRVLTLKTERKTADWLQALRQRNQQQNNFGKDNYWQEVKGVVEVRQPRPLKEGGEKSRSEPNFHYPLKDSTGSQEEKKETKKRKNLPM